MPHYFNSIYAKAKHVAKYNRLNANMFINLSSYFYVLAYIVYVDTC